MNIRFLNVLTAAMALAFPIAEYEFGDRFGKVIAHPGIAPVEGIQPFELDASKRLAETLRAVHSNDYDYGVRGRSRNQ